MAKSNDALWWSLFGAGGTVAAFLMPITIFLTGIATFAGWLSERALFDFLHHPLTRLYLFVLIFLSLFHAAHRIYLTLPDLGVRGARGSLAALLYGAAIVGTLATLVGVARM